VACTHHIHGVMTIAGVAAVAYSDQELAEHGGLMFDYCPMCREDLAEHRQAPHQATGDNSEQ
jgi:hypothetical protein